MALPLAPLPASREREKCDERCYKSATSPDHVPIWPAKQPPKGPMLTTNPFDVLDPDGEKLREECCIFGISGSEGAAALVALGLHALQHRGQEAAGITSFDGCEFHTHRAMGHVAGNFDRDEI